MPPSSGSRKDGGTDMKPMKDLKRFVKWCLIADLCWWLLVWIIGSYHTGRLLSIDDLIPTADAWLAPLDEKGRP